MKKIKLYFFHPYSRIGGADLSLSRLINSLDKKKYSITFITLEKPKINYYLNRKIDIKVIKQKRVIFSIFDLREIVKKNKEKFSKVIFLSNQNFANVISIISLLGIKWVKIILIERNNPIELNYSGKIKDKIIKVLIKLTYRFSDRIIAISKELGRDLQKLCKKKVTTIYNPSFDKNILKFIKKKKNSDTKIILNVARFEKQKNHSMLLESFKDIHNQVNANLLLVGYGAEKKKISNFINKNKLNNRIIIVKDYINVFKYYKIADLFVLTSLYEGFGNVLVEAGIFKIPIISTDCKSGPKEILNNGKYGDLVKIGQTKKLSKLILKNLKFPNKNKITKMYKSLKRFNIQNHINAYEKIFKEI
ncbi:glycosyltransferase [Candidatus Pelagibacter sp. HIMB1506]|uniref:glycosyltransferase n=1 Tax=Candidatus Pelagibacter sp. HIMB1506 TaxID=3413337 RepID=UPI003F839AC6